MGQVALPITYLYEQSYKLAFHKVTHLDLDPSPPKLNLEMSSPKPYFFQGT